MKPLTEPWHMLECSRCWRQPKNLAAWEDDDGERVYCTPCKSAVELFRSEQRHAQVAEAVDRAYEVNRHGL